LQNLIKSLFFGGRHFAILVEREGEILVQTAGIDYFSHFVASAFTASL
jgi:hypothetical protein